MRIEIVHEKGSIGIGLRLVAETDAEVYQLREVKSMGIEAKVKWVEFAVPRRRNSKEGQSTLLDADA